MYTELPNPACGDWIECHQGTCDCNTPAKCDICGDMVPQIDLRNGICNNCTKELY